MDIISMDTRLFDTLLRRMKAIEEKVTALCARGEDLILKHEPLLNITSSDLPEIKALKSKYIWIILILNVSM